MYTHLVLAVYPKGYKPGCTTIFQNYSGDVWTLLLVSVGLLECGNTLPGQHPLASVVHSHPTIMQWHHYVYEDYWKVLTRQENERM